MTSSKRTFGPRVFNTRSFASGVFRGNSLAGTEIDNVPVSVIPGYDGTSVVHGNYSGLVSVIPGYTRESFGGGEPPVDTIFDYNSNIARDGSDVTEDLAAALNAAAAHKGRVLIPYGTYGIRDSLLTLLTGERLEIWGEGVGGTIISALDDITDPVFFMDGPEDYAAPYPSPFQQRFFLNHIQFETNGFNVPWISAQFCAYLTVAHCAFRQNLGVSFRGLSVWDSVFMNVEFAGGGTVGEAAVTLEDNPSGSGNCNNIVFFNNRFEQLDGAGIYIGDDARKIALMRCKFDGNGLGVTYDGAKACFIGDGTQFTGQDGSGIEGVDGNGMIINGCIFDRNGDYGADVGNSLHTLITNNVFGLPEANITGNYLAPSGTNVIANNILA